MHNSIAFWKFLVNSISNGLPSVLLYVLESKGSSPGRQGFGMAINSAGDMMGSIGGGIMEHKLIEQAKDILESSSREANVRKQVHDKSISKDRSGMICSGEQTIFMYTIVQEDLFHIENLIESLDNNENGTLTLTPSGIRFSRSLPEMEYNFIFNSQADWIYKEKTGYSRFVYIAGGGHCSLALSQLLRPLGFYIRVYDDRRDLKTLRENNWAHEKILLKDYSEFGGLIQEGPDNYVVLMTFGYRTDDIALRSITSKKFKYLGVLGSQSKMKTLFQSYREEGVSESWLSVIKSPVGLKINSQTPWEIAISIAAEIISVKNKAIL